MKKLLEQLDKVTALFRDERTGIAFVEDGHTGSIHSAHPNIDASGSVVGMKNRGYWSWDARTVSCHGIIYNIDSVVITSDLDKLAKENCRCGGKYCLNSRKRRSL